MSVLERLGQAIKHIERHLDSSVDVGGRRGSRCHLGAPGGGCTQRWQECHCSEYTRHRRLTVAGAEVLAGGRTLLEIAVRYGCGPREAFGWAFHAVPGVWLGKARRSAPSLDGLSPHVDRSSSMRYRFVRRLPEENRRYADARTG